MKRCALVLGFLLLAGVAGAQEPDRPSLLVTPWVGPEAPNLAAQITERVRGGVEALGLFDPVEWETLLSSVRATREIPEPSDEALCIVGRQLAYLEGIDYALCGQVGPTPDGLRVDFALFEIGSGGPIQFDPIVARDRDALVDHVLTQLAAWGRPRGPAR